MRRRKIYFLAVLVATALLILCGVAMLAPAKGGDGDAFDYRHDLRWLCCHSAVCTESR